MISEEYFKNPYADQWFKMCKKRIQMAKSFYCNGTYPYRSFTTQVVESIFELANELGMNNEAKYKVVELYDRYLSEMFVHKYEKVCSTQPSKWENVLKQCEKKSYLRLMSCMLLISKYTATTESSMLKLNDVEAVLRRKGYVYSSKEIVSSEVKVFQIIGGDKINQPSVFTIVKFFINVIQPFQTTETIYSVCLVLTDLVYIHLQEFYNWCQSLENGHRAYTYDQKLKLLDIEYDKISTAAAVVLTALFIMSPSNDNVNIKCIL